jgi:hypothetical protein
MGIWERGSLGMDTQQQKLSVLSALGISAILSRQTKRKPPALKISAKINQPSYNKWLVLNRFALSTARRYA